MSWRLRLSDPYKALYYASVSLRYCQQSAVADLGPAHGDTQGSLLHEGSAVGAGGGKLVIRTDLLYEAKGFGQYKPPTSVGFKQGGKEEEGLGG